MSTTTIRMPWLRLVALIAVVLAIPLSASAASPRPTCSLTVSTPEGEERIRDDEGKIFLQKGSELRIAWQSRNAVRAMDTFGDSSALSGSATSSPSETTEYSYRFSSGSKKVTCAVEVRVVTGTIDASSLISASTKPSVSGALSGVRTAELTVRKAGTTKKLYTSKVKITQGKWTERITKKLPNGTYDVVLSGSKDVDLNTIVRGVLTIDTEYTKGTIQSPASATTLVVAPVPLLSGGVVRAGGSVPVSYLQIANIGKEAAFLKGFWVKQNGSAPPQTVIGFATVDDQGGSRGFVGGVEGSTLFTTDGLALAPADALFAPGQMRLFTIKAILSRVASAHAGKQLMLDVIGVETNASAQGLFPISGTTWTISN